MLSRGKLRKVFNQPRCVIPDRLGDWDRLTNRCHPTVKGALLAVCAEVFRDCVCAVTLWTIAHQATLSIDFSRQEYWSRLPFPPPGELPNPGIKPASLCLLHWQEDSLPLCHLGSLGIHYQQPIWEMLSWMRQRFIAEQNMCLICVMNE